MTASTAPCLRGRRGFGPPSWKTSSTTVASLRTSTSVMDRPSTSLTEHPPPARSPDRPLLLRDQIDRWTSATDNLMQALRQSKKGSCNEPRRLLRQEDRARDPDRPANDRRCHRRHG